MYEKNYCPDAQDGGDTFNNKEFGSTIGIQSYDHALQRQRCKKYFTTNSKCAYRPKLMFLQYGTHQTTPVLRLQML
jgi:hypothetical protein